MTTNVKLTSPRELLAVVLYLLGFHPTNSVVTLCLLNNKLGLTQRLDLPRPQDAHDVAKALLPSLVTENPDSVILVGYEDRAGDSLPALESLTEALHSHAVQVHERLVVRDGRGRSLDCHSLSAAHRRGARCPNRQMCPASFQSSSARGCHLIRIGLPWSDRSSQDPRPPQSHG